MISGCKAVATKKCACARVHTHKPHIRKQMSNLILYLQYIGMHAERNEEDPNDSANVYAPNTGRHADKTEIRELSLHVKVRVH